MNRPHRIRSVDRLSRAFAAVLSLAVVALVSASHAASMLPPTRDPLVVDRDTTVSPAADFFEYANGGWMHANPIPPTERGWGIASVIREMNYLQLRRICEESASSGAARGTSAQKVGDLWATGMDSVAIERLGVTPIRPYLAEIAAVKDRAGLLDEMAHLRTLGFGTMFSFSVDQDSKNTEKYVVYLTQGGLGLPDRDYYFDADSSTRHIRAEYAKHVAAMFRLTGATPAAARAASANVMRIETELAGRSRTLEQLRDPWENYNKRTVAQLARLTPSIDWPRHLGRLGVHVDTVVVGQPEFLAHADSTLRRVPLEAWKDYLRWNVVHGVAAQLSSPFAKENFHFYGTVLSGVKAQRPRWKRILDAEEDGIGEILGQEWVKRYCSPATKARYEKLTHDIIDTYRERMRALPWMSPETKARAIEKLDHVAIKVGYPDVWRDFSTLQLDRTSYVGNTVAIDGWWYRHEIEKLGKPIDRTEWDMTPQTYNAYYNGQKVEIVLPAAAFMIPDIADSLVDDALLYSYAGASTIGHEITHGFDDEGRQSDEHGNLNAWWTDQDSIQFTQRVHRLATQFDGYVEAGKHVRGQATLGENLADLGGVRLGYEAFKKTDQWKRGEKLNGLTPDQRFFLGYAYSWMGSRRPESTAQLIMSDVHAPQDLRVNGPLANIPEFYAAFGVKPGDAMWRDDSVRVEVW